jgi:PAS domain-containing protein
MSSAKATATPTTPAIAAEEAFPRGIVTSRWLLVLAVISLLVFGSQGQARLVPHYALAAAMVLSNALLAWLRTGGPRWARALEVITVADVLALTLVIGWVDPSPHTYLVVFAALVLASALGRVGLVMSMMLLVCGAYAGYLYTEIGADFWRRVELIVRVPFLFAIGLHFATIAAYMKTEKAERESLVLEARQYAERAQHLSQEQDRLRALSQIGRLGLTAANAHPVKILLEIAHRAQRALEVDRCTVVIFARENQAQAWNGHSKDNSVEVRTLACAPDALDAILLNSALTELHPGESKDLLANVKVFFPDSNPFGSLLVAPVNADDKLVGALFLIDKDHQRKFNDGERDFFWTASLMSGAFIGARERLESETRLRTLITNAPLIMFALGTDGVIQLFEGKGSAMLRKRPSEFVGKSLFEVAGNRDATEKAFAAAASGRMVTGTLELCNVLFETQYSPLRGVDGEISGVMGVTTAILDAPQPAARPAAPAGANQAPSDPMAPKRPLEPKIPLADEPPVRKPKIPLADEAPARQPKIPLADEAPARQPKIPLADEAPARQPGIPLADELPARQPVIPLADEAPAGEADEAPDATDAPLPDEASNHAPDASLAREDPARGHDAPLPGEASEPQPAATSDDATDATGELEKVFPEWWTDRVQ